MKVKHGWLAVPVIMFTFFSTPQSKSASLTNSATESVEVESRPQNAEWTVMIYMDGDNNLEEDALIDFMEMARVGSTDKVNIVVQLDRIGKYVPKTDKRYTYWTETLRFRVTKRMKPSPESAFKEPKIGEANMGAGNTLEEFVSWTKSTFPAKRYALIIWDHGQGWRGARTGFRTPIGSPFRTLSFDETNQDKLYNAEVQQSLQTTLKGEKLDLIGFDACLMAMVETAYAMQDVAETFVGSEELEPGTGWQYDDWLNVLTDRPTIDGRALSKVLVDSFQNSYGTATEFSEPNPITTLSAVDLSQMVKLADAISALSKTLIAKFNSERLNVKSARDGCSVYAPNTLGDGRNYFLHVDLARFCEQLIAHTKDQEIKTKTASVLAIIKASILRNYRGVDRGGTFGSNGLAIYFPPNGSSYEKDWLKEDGYENCRTRPAGKKPPDFPVEFVEDHYWSDFLHAYFKYFPG
jgi:hypothetical protein